RGGLRRRLPPARSAARALHVVEQPRTGVGEERRLAARLPGGHAGNRGEGEACGELHRRALLGPRAAADRVRGALKRQTTQPTNYVTVAGSPCETSRATSSERALIHASEMRR